MEMADTYLQIARRGFKSDLIPSAPCSGPALESPRQQLSESREVGLLVLGAAIAERHGSEDEPDPTPPTRDGRHAEQPS